MYSKIQDPISSNKFSVSSTKGKQILQKYIQLIGGENIDEKSQEPELYYHNPKTFTNEQFNKFNIMNRSQYHDFLENTNLPQNEKQRLYNEFINGENETRDYYNTFIKVSDNRDTFNQLDTELGMKLALKNNDTEQLSGGGNDFRFTKSALYQRYKENWTFKQSQIGGSDFKNDFRDVEKFNKLSEQFGGEEPIDVDAKLNEIINNQCKLFTVNGQELELPEMFLCTEAYDPDITEAEREKK